jgi:uncharacterized protein YrrD
MQKMQDIIGLPLLETETGQQIGFVKDIVLSMVDVRVCGIILEDELISDKEILFTELFSMGRDAIMLRHYVLHRRNSLFKATDIYYKRDLLQKEIFTEDGLRLGELVDILFEKKTGEMKWYQVSDSIITDLLYGRMLIPLPKVQVIGMERVIIPGVIKITYNEI